MGLSGSYLACMLHAVALPPVRMYRDVCLTKVLPAFDNLEEVASEFELQQREQLYAESSSVDDDDGGGLAEEAYNGSVTFYTHMSQTRQGVLNLFTVGLFHLFEQQLCNVWRDATIKAMGISPPDANLHKIADWMKQRVEYDLRESRFWDQLEDLHHIANVAKHAEGPSAEQLRTRRPDVFGEPRYAELVGLEPPPPSVLRRPLAGEDLFVQREMFETLAENPIAALLAIAAHFKSNSAREYPR